MKGFDMSKQELIDNICDNSRGADKSFLEMFTERELDLYLEKLLEIDLEALAQCA